MRIKLMTSRLSSSGPRIYSFILKTADNNQDGHCNQACSPRLIWLLPSWAAPMDIANQQLVNKPAVATLYGYQTSCTSVIDDAGLWTFLFDKYVFPLCFPLDLCWVFFQI